MKDNDLLNNPLLDDGVKIAKKAMSAHDNIQKVMFYGTMLKFGGIAIVGILLLWGGYTLVTSIGDMVTDAVVEETKAVANEKYNEAKTKASEKIAEVKENTEGQSFFGGLVKVTQDIDAKINDAVDDTLVENGYHPDAPAACAFRKPENDDTCKKYSDAEIPGTEYEWIKVSWIGVCSSVYDEALQRLKENGKVTENDVRMLRNDCLAIHENVGNTKREELKKQMLEGAEL